MITQRELDLLVDLAKLLKKHGPEPFESLVASISSPEITQQISSILTQIANTGRTIPKTKRRTSQKKEPSVPRSLTALKSVDLEKYQLLIVFYNDLIAKKILPSLRDIKDFAIHIGLGEIRANSRQRALSPLINSLTKLQNKQLIEKIQSLKRYDISDRSLEGWSNIILHKE